VNKQSTIHKIQDNSSKTYAFQYDKKLIWHNLNDFFENIEMQLTTPPPYNPPEKYIVN
jgi:hypothetical protein